jgi:hypothetical protein
MCAVCLMCVARTLSAKLLTMCQDASVRLVLLVTQHLDVPSSSSVQLRSSVQLACSVALVSVLHPVDHPGSVWITRFVLVAPVYPSARIQPNVLCYTLAKKDSVFR